MNNQQQPNQDQQIKKAKTILWLGIVVIIVVGLAVAVYFIFIKTSGQENVNAVKNANTATNINKAININVDTGDWQTVEYNHEPYVFSLRLPSNWKVNTQLAVAERQPMVSAYYGFDDGAVSFYVSYYNNTKSLKSWVDEHLKELEKSHEIISYQDSDFSHNDFTIVAGDVKETFRHLYAYYSHGSYVYELRFELELNDYPSLKNILQAIISTFQFTDTIDTSDWQTYKNINLGITFKYPKKWGEVVDKANDYTSGNQYNKGRNFIISFKDKRSVEIIAVSNEYLGFKQDYYTGNKELNNECSVLSDSLKDGICNNKIIDGYNTYELYQYGGDECAEWILRSVPLNLSNDIYNGLLIKEFLEMPIPNDNPEPCSMRSDVNIQNNLKAITFRDKISASQNELLQEFDALLSTFQFIK